MNSEVIKKIKLKQDTSTEWLINEKKLNNAENKEGWVALKRFLFNKVTIVKIILNNIFSEKRNEYIKSKMYYTVKDIILLINRM